MRLWKRQNLSSYWNSLINQAVTSLKLSFLVTSTAVKSKTSPTIVATNSLAAESLWRMTRPVWWCEFFLLVSIPRRLRYTLFVMYNRQMACLDMVCHSLSLFEMIRNLVAWSDMVQPFVSHVLHVPTWSDIVRGGLTIQHTMEPSQRTIYAGSCSKMWGKRGQRRNIVKEDLSINEMERLIEQRERELKNGKGKGLDNDMRGLIDSIFLKTNMFMWLLHV